MIDIAFANLFEQLDWSSLLWGGLWAGLVAFTLGLSFLLWTRWGEYHLTGKCVLFSLLAHLLLGLFFATAEVVEDVVVAMQRDTEHEPITIERVKIVQPAEELAGESNVDGRSEEAKPGIWDRPSTDLQIGSTTPARESIESPEAAIPQRVAARDTVPLAVETPKPEVPLATAQASQPELTRPTPETSDRAESITAPGDPAARAMESKRPVVPVTDPDRPAPDFAAPGVQRAKESDPAGSSPEPVPSSLSAASSPSIPDAPAAPNSPAIRPESMPKSAAEPTELTGPIATPAMIKRDDAKSSSTSSNAEPSSSVRIGLSPGSGSDPPGPLPKRSGDGEKVELPRVRLGAGDGAGVAAGSAMPKIPGTAFRPSTAGLNAASGADRDGVRLGTPEIYRERMNPNRSEQALTRGGSKASEQAVERALQWLAAHQHPDGHWDADQFQANCPAGQACTGPGSQNRDDCAITGLALMAFLGAGNTHWSGKYSTQVLNGLNWLITQEKTNGDLRGNGRMYSQGIATLALSEALAMSGDPKLKEPVQRAINFIIAAQNSSTGGWRYLPGQYGDTSIFGWQLMALKSASMSGIEIPEVTWQRARSWLKMVGSGRYRGLAAYQPAEAATPAMTAEALVCRVFLGDQPDNPTLREAADYLMQYTPQWSRLNLYYWYYGTLACFQMGGTYWEKWNSGIRDILIEHQTTQGHAAGSWDPNPLLDPWGREGGRVYSTALATLCLEVYYRFLPVQSLSGSDGTAPNHATPQQ